MITSPLFQPPRTLFLYNISPLLLFLIFLQFFIIFFIYFTLLLFLLTPLIFIFSLTYFVIFVLFFIFYVNLISFYYPCFLITLCSLDRFPRFDKCEPSSLTDKIPCLWQIYLIIWRKLLHFNWSKPVRCWILNMTLLKIFFSGIRLLYALLEYWPIYSRIWWKF